ncbi:hypothetical protein EYF80_033863 [Liparis tanakae]|uniref:Uncharacterized protein n=1 Tax=Liparis tanakae TaxID=230148 RepID=A0A4Z2GQT5_9TELE|nr:hypothetical protein EYF80_033863 [Liparis tanakae]
MPTIVRKLSRRIRCCIKVKEKAKWCSGESVQIYLHFRSALMDPPFPGPERSEELNKARATSSAPRSRQGTRGNAFELRRDEFTWAGGHAQIGVVLKSCSEAPRQLGLGPLSGEREEAMRFRSRQYTVHGTGTSAFKEGKEADVDIGWIAAANAHKVKKWMPAVQNEENRPSCRLVRVQSSRERGFCSDWLVAMLLHMHSGPKTPPHRSGRDSRSCGSTKAQTGRERERIPPSLQSLSEDTSVHTDLPVLSSRIVRICKPNTPKETASSNLSKHLAGRAVNDIAPRCAQSSFSSIRSSASRSLSVEQDEGLQLLGDVPPVVEAVLDDGPGGQALQRGVVYGLDYIPGQLLLVQEVAGHLLEGVGAVEVSPA